MFPSVNVIQQVILVVILIKLTAPVPTVPSLTYQAVHDLYVATTYRNPGEEEEFSHEAWVKYYNLSLDAFQQKCVNMTS